MSGPGPHEHDRPTGDPAPARHALGSASKRVLIPSILAFTLVAGAIIRYAVVEEQKTVRRHERIAELQHAVDSLEWKERTTAHVALNGALFTIGGDPSECKGDELGEHLCVDGSKKIDLDAMFPKDGDAPGDDLVGVPRPASSRRQFSATVLETGHAVRVYEVLNTDAASADFAKQMAAAGFTYSPAVDKDVPGVRLYLRGAERIIVTSDPMPGGERVTIARVSLP